MTTLLTVWPEDQPPLPVFLHELQSAGMWLERLQSFSTARLILSSERVKPLPPGLAPTALLVSRLAAEDAAQLQVDLPDIRATDLRRLPPNRAVFKQVLLSTIEKWLIRILCEMVSKAQVKFVKY